MLKAVQISQAKVSTIRWKLREVMARRRITNKALAEALGLHPTSVARAKAQDIMPELGGDSLAQYIGAINRLSSDQYGVCTLEELIEYEE
ncbi:MAG: helix-turn-helix domain-containing protein [Synechococcus sp.]